jgi:hypothetical protein
MLRTGLSPSSTRSIQRHSRLVGTLWTASEANDDSGRDSPLQETCQRRGEIYAPISVIYGELQDLFMEIVPNVGLFIQVPVDFFEGTNGRKTRDTPWTHLNSKLERKTGRGLDTKKKGAGFPAPFWWKLVCVRR